MAGTYGSGAYGLGDYGPNLGQVDDTPTTPGYHLTPVIGSGSAANPFRPAAAEYTVDWATLIPTDPSGYPTNPWALTTTIPSTSGLDIGELANISLPKVGLDETLGLNGLGRTALQASLVAAIGFSLTLTASTTLREVVEEIGQVLTGEQFVAEQQADPQAVVE